MCSVHTECGNGDFVTSYRPTRFMWTSKKIVIENEVGNPGIWATDSDITFYLIGDVIQSLLHLVVGVSVVAVVF